MKVVKDKINRYRTIKDCAVDMICKYGDNLSNRKIADKVREIMKSDTSAKCIAWYKSKMKSGVIRVDKDKCKWLRRSGELYKEKPAISGDRKALKYDFHNGNTLLKEIRKCEKCGLKIHRPLVFGNIEKNKFVFLSEEPTIDARDNNFFKYYLGPPNGRFHTKWMPKMGIDEDWLKTTPYITHVYKCCSEKKKKSERDKLCQSCLDWLEMETRYFQSGGKVIVTFGAYARSNLLPDDYKELKVAKIIKEKRIFLFGKSVVIPLPHPSPSNNNIINKYQKEIEYILAIIRMFLHDVTITA